MQDFVFAEREHFRDSSALFVHKVCTEIFHLDEEAASQKAAEFGRDKNRTPMQWCAGPNAGFSPEGVTTWLPINPDHQQGINVAAQMERDDTLWHYYHELLKLRKAFPALIIGDFVEYSASNTDIYGFLRSTGSQKLLVLLNLGTAECKVPASKGAKVLFSSAGVVDKLSDNTISIKPFTSVILSIKE